ncbi:MAG: TIGR02302 family protein [Bradyrhizobiaceae bacterium]|nr:MAG: TIGR02302 family protein [Bradyrhizobiaceae bacterium]
MSGQIPDSPQTPPSEEDVLLKAIARAVQHARLAIAWERLWPSLARVLTVVGLFLAASWAGVWMVAPFVLRVAGVAIFAIAGLAALVPLVRFRWPAREEALRRLDLDSGIAHRPATALTDTLRSEDPVALALWNAQRARMRASLDRIRARLPSPNLPRHDPLALRAAAILLLIATFIAAGDERTARFMQAVDWNGMFSGTPARIDAWVDPPPYTNRPPVVISGPQKAASAEEPISVPAGSTLIVRASGGSLDVSLSGGVAAAAETGDAPKNTDERRFTIATDGSARVRSPSSLPQWSFKVIPDHAPTIALAKDPERQAHGGLSLSYKLEDDYGVTQAQAHIALRNSDDDGTPEKATSPLYDPIAFALGLPSARTKTGVGQTVKDLSEHPYAGAEVRLTLTAKDEAGNEGRSEPFNMRLPQRVFNKPLARALIEQRRILALDASQKPLVMIALEALLVAPQAFTPESGEYLGLHAVANQLAHANTREALRGTVDSLWALAVAIEDKNVTDVEKALRAAQDALKQALERGASDEEIKKLTQDLRAALSDYLRQLAQQLQKNPQELARPLDRNARVMSEQDLKAMIDRMERLARSGDKEAAQQLLEQMQQMLENLQMAQPGQGDQDMQQALNELSDLARKQQQLRDKTYNEGQNSRDSRREQQEGRNAMGDLQREQQNLRDRLQKLLDGMKQKGMMPQQGGKQPGEDGELSEGNPLGDADNAMGEAGGQLGQGSANGAVDAQGRAVEALKKGAQNLAQQNQGDGEGQQGNRFGQRQSGGQDTDPLGRPLKGRDYSDDQSVKIPGEIDVQRVRRILEELRRRLGDSYRPQIELDYIERLLKDY